MLFFFLDKKEPKNQGFMEIQRFCLSFPAGSHPNSPLLRRDSNMGALICLFNEKAKKSRISSDFAGRQVRTKLENPSSGLKHFH
ncbi:MAG: hypothetical protein H6575_00015 [Lewinellaceae bacterium]|nr:hypothetical protein [Lewinellaceae bacterium]